MSVVIGRVVDLVGGCLVRVSVGGFLRDVVLGDSLCGEELLSVIRSGREVFLKLLVDGSGVKVLGLLVLAVFPLRVFGLMLQDLSYSLGILGCG